jgi:methanogenic corrinoid protein MtbC1
MAASAVAVEFMAGVGSRLDVIADLFEPAQLHVADRWRHGEVTTSEEYRIYRAIATALTALPEPERHPFQPALSMLLVTISPEEHDLGLDLTAAVLSDDGWNVEVARRVSARQVAERVQQKHHGLVGISSTYVARHLRAPLAAAVAGIHAIGRQVILGGSALWRAPDLAAEIGADAAVTDARQALVVARHLTGTARRRWRAASRASA